MVWALLARAAGAVAKVVRNPEVRRKIVEGARRVAAKAKDSARRAMEFCRGWGPNRRIRQAYNARRKVLDAEIKAMRRANAPPEKIAEAAHKFRHGERMRARAEMLKNGDRAGVDRLRARDLKKYGNPDGPDFKQSVARAGEKLRESLGRDPTPDEVFTSIAESATRTDPVTNLLYLSF